MPVTIQCEECESEFEVKPYRSDSARFCCKSCHHKSMKNEEVVLVCDSCGNDFSVKQSRANTARFCSKSCYDSARSDIVSGEDAPGWRGGRKTNKECEQCDEKFELYESRLDTARFCSPQCRHDYLSEHLKQSSTNVRDSSEYRNWRESVKSRDGCCVDCGSTEGLHAHHIIPVEKDESLATDVSNGETLCQECHANKHPEIAHLIDPKS